MIGGKNESFCEYSFSKIGASLVITVGAHSLLSFLEVNYAGYFSIHLCFAIGRLRRGNVYRAQRPTGTFD